MDIDKISPDIIQRTEEMQNEMHSIVEQIYQQKKKSFQEGDKPTMPFESFSYQDATNVYLLLKISELQENFKKLKEDFYELRSELKYRH